MVLLNRAYSPQWQIIYSRIRNIRWYMWDMWDYRMVLLFMIQCSACSNLCRWNRRLVLKPSRSAAYLWVKAPAATRCATGTLPWLDLCHISPMQIIHKTLHATGSLKVQKQPADQPAVTSRHACSERLLKVFMPPYRQETRRCRWHDDSLTGPDNSFQCQSGEAAIISVALHFIWLDFIWQNWAVC